MGESSRRQQAAVILLQTGHLESPAEPSPNPPPPAPTEPSPHWVSAQTLPGKVGGGKGRRGAGRGAKTSRGPSRAPFQDVRPGFHRQNGEPRLTKSRHLRMPPARPGSSFPQHPLQGCEAWLCRAGDRTAPPLDDCLCGRR